MQATPGTPAPTPPNFSDHLMIGGTRLAIRYFRTIKLGRDTLDGWLETNAHEIWVSTWRRSPGFIASTILHEALHFALRYWAKTEGEWTRQAQKGSYLPQLNMDEEDQLVMLFEHYLGAVLRQTPWFHALLGPADA